MFQCFNQCGSECSTGCRNSLPFRNGLKFIDNSYRSLSAEEQERIHRDLYGVEEPVEETPEFVEVKLEELGKELNLLNESVKRAYLQAMKQEQDGTLEPYVSSRKFRLMFLRAQRFDASKAASHLARYLKDKLDVFGNEVLARRITEEDLSMQDKETLTSGFCCVTNETDGAGRLVMFIRRCLLFGQDVNSLLRSVFYLLQIAVEDNEEAQKKGLVIPVYNVGAQLIQWNSQARKYAPIFRHCAYTLPIRIAAFHLFYSDAKETIMLNFCAVIYPNHLRSRIHCHYVPTHEDCLFLLMSLGINPDALPFTEEGVFQKEALCTFLEQQQHDRAVQEG